MNKTAINRSTSADKPINVLLVDDSVQDYRLISVLVNTQAKANYRFDWARNSEEAEERLNRGDIDLVAVDYNLGLEEGSDVISRLSFQFPDLPFVLVTGNEDPEIYKTGLQAGATNFIPKGKDCGALFDRSAKYAIERKRLENSLKISNASKDWLMSLIAKDLGNPLFALNQLLSDLSKEAANMPREMLIELIESAYHSSCEAIVSVNQMLEWGRSIKGAVRPSMSMNDIEKIITGSIRLLTTLADEREIFIARRGVCDFKAFCDERMLSTVVRNLLSAAIYYSNDSDTITVSTEPADRALMISITSGGRGIDPHLISLLANQSETLSDCANTEERQALSSIQIASHLLDAMGLALSLSNHPNKSIVFKFKLSLTLPIGII